MVAVRAGEVDAVVVSELSRLTREGAHDASEIDKEFEKHGDLVVSVLEPDADNPEHVAIVERMLEMSWDGVADNKIATTFESERIPAPGSAERRATEKRLESIRKRRVSDGESPIRWRAQTVRWIINHPAMGGFASERVKRGKAHDSAPGNHSGRDVA